MRWLHELWVTCLRNTKAFDGELCDKNNNLNVSGVFPTICSVGRVGLSGLCSLSARHRRIPEARRRGPPRWDEATIALAPPQCRHQQIAKRQMLVTSNLRPNYNHLPEYGRHSHGITSSQTLIASKNLPLHINLTLYNEQLYYIVSVKETISFLFLKNKVYNIFLFCIHSQIHKDLGFSFDLFTDSRHVYLRYLYFITKKATWTYSRNTQIYDGEHQWRLVNPINKKMSAWRRRFVSNAGPG